VRQKLESDERNMVLIILRTTRVVTLIEEDIVGGIVRLYDQKSVVLPTKTLKAQGEESANSQANAVHSDYTRDAMSIWKTRARGLLQQQRRRFQR